MYTNSLDRQDLLKGSTQFDFNRITRCNIIIALLKDRLRKCLTIQLLVGRHWKLIQSDKRTWHHISWKMDLQVLFKPAISSSCPVTYATSFWSLSPVVLTSTTASVIPSICLRTFSISPSSIRNPRILT